MSLMDFMKKTQEAQAVRLGIPVARKYSDDALAESMQALTEAERDISRELYGGMSADERLGKLGPEERSLLEELTGKNLTAFRVAITVDERTELINVLATDACAATVQAYEIAFGGFYEEKPRSIKVRVEPAAVQALRRAA